jgi:hypothetical protein
VHSGSMQNEGIGQGVVNPLGLPVEWRPYITPSHEVTSADRVAGLAAAMERDGWAGPPIVADCGLRLCNQDRAYTGAHRLAAWARARGEAGVPVPCVWIEDIAEAAGLDWNALLDEHEGDSYLAAADLCSQVPAGIREAYGLDAG